MISGNPIVHKLSKNASLTPRSHAKMCTFGADLRVLGVSIGLTLQKGNRFDRFNRSFTQRAMKAQNKKFTGSANKLMNEQSPELIKYADSAVAWYPWGEEAFQKAQSDNKMILLSIGFSSSHWCYLMKKESFDDPETAKFINENFIPIKVDREERPDLDRWCSIFVYLTLGKTGWPITMFLTPDRIPIFGASYLPNVERFGLPDFKSILVDFVHEWNTEKERIIIQSNEGMKKMTDAFIREPLPFKQGFTTDASLVDELMNNCVNYLIQDYDEDNGGFGEKEKFPHVSYLNLLMRQYQRKLERTKNDAVAYLRKMIVGTLGGMNNGGIHDQIAGGFHRYTIDQIWHVPEFEKMLIDNASIAKMYLFADQLFPDRNWRETARSTLDCLKRDFQSPEGGFYSSLGCDSAEKETGNMREGAYYTWSASEIKSVIPKDHYNLFARYYNVMEDGNCNIAKAKDQDPIFTNILVIREKWEDVARDLEIQKTEFQQILADCRKKLYEARTKNRDAPARDEKIISGWNGMAVSAFALASRILPNEKHSVLSKSLPVEGTAPKSYLDTATQAAEFILKNLWEEGEEVEHLLRYYYNGNRSSIEAYAEDYAHVIAGFLDLYSCSGKLKWLKWSVRLQEKLDASFWDNETGSYFSSTENNQSPPIRTKMNFDAEEPCASSVSVSNLLRLGGIYSKSFALREKAIEIIQRFAPFAQDEESALPELAASSCLIDLNPSFLKVIVIGDPENERSENFLKAMHHLYNPGKTLVFINPELKESIAFWREAAPEIVEHCEPYWDVNKAEEMELEIEFRFPLLFICDNFEFFGPYDNPDILLNYIKSD